MKYAIISDVHANPAALERVLADAKRCGADKVVCAGDVVGYGPDPAGAIRILRERGIPVAMGNHDVAVADYVGIGYMIGSAQDGVARHRAEAVLKLRDLRLGDRRGPVSPGRIRLQGLCGGTEGKGHLGPALGGRTNIFLRIP